MSTEESLSESERDLLDAVPDALKNGVELLEWWRQADAESSYEERYDETLVFNRPDDTSYGFFDRVELTGKGKVRINGNVQRMFYDEPKAPPDAKLTAIADEWMDSQIREFVLRYFMRISDFRLPQLVAESHEDPPPGLGFLSQCPEEKEDATGFGFTQLYFKKRDGETGKFAEDEQDKIVDLRRLEDEYEWIVLKNPIFGFGFDFKPFGRFFETFLGAAGPQVKLPAKVFNYLVLSNDFVVNEAKPAKGVRSRYGLGYAFVNDPEPSVYGYGPGQLQPAFEQLVWEVHDSGQITVRAAFVAEEPTKILKLSVDPLAWGFQFTKAIGGELPGFLKGVKRAWDDLPFTNVTFDPVLPTVRLLNAVTAGEASRRFCISKDQIIKEALFLHFQQHYQTIVGSLQTWRQIRDWTAKEDKLPDWVVSGKSA
ncbi:MAG TPA: hypothetical protein VGG06_17585 [Thermoanaerobaculia bacterium]